MLFLLFAIAMSALLAWLVVWQARRPKSLEEGIDEFAAGLDALAPPDDPRHGTARREPSRYGTSRNGKGRRDHEGRR